ELPADQSAGPRHRDRAGRSTDEGAGVRGVEVQVIAALRQVASGLTLQEEHRAITALSGAQAGFVLRYHESHPDQADKVDAVILMNGLRDGFDHLSPEMSDS
ncbi:hypothetical protein V1463_11950, partial [Micrococcus yunnanensis]|uniref:hypothetical protein n=1 Tax=Micrococcus yunnanensis TaxID=566027 RepID=UPI00300E5618